MLCRGPTAPIARPASPVSPRRTVWAAALQEVGYDGQAAEKTVPASRRRTGKRPPAQADSNRATTAVMLSSPPRSFASVISRSQALSGSCSS